MVNVLSNLKTRFINWRQWEFNPVVVKELRQAVRSWAVTGMLLLFLAVLFCTSVGLLVSQSFNESMNQRLGATIFQSFFAILAGASILFIPLYVGVRLAAERQESNLDLLYTSTLTPGSIIRGKFLCGAYTALLFFSACMPFMAFTNLLRGVDLPSIFLLLVYLFVVVCAAVMVAIFLACLPVSKGFKVLLGLGGVIGGFFFVIPLVMVSWQMMRSGVGAMIGAREFLAGFSTSGAMTLAGLVLLYYLSVALISPVSANRALPLRIYMTIAWLLGGALSCFWIFHQNELRLILPWAMVTFVLMVPALIVIASGNDQLSVRVRRDIPANRVKRALAFLFFNGSAGGLAWAGLLLAATFAVTNGLLQWNNITSRGARDMSASDVREFLTLSSATLAYTFAYVLTGLFIQRTFFSRRSSKLAGVFITVIVAGTALIPGIALFFLNQLSWRAIEKLQLGNVFNMFAVRNSWEQGAHLTFAVVWLLIIAAFNAKWFLAQMKRFRPLEYNTQTPVQPAPPPQSPAQA